MTLEDSIKSITEKLNNLTEEELNTWSEQLQNDSLMIAPIMTKYSIINPNERWVTFEEFKNMKSGIAYITHDR